MASYSNGSILISKVLTEKLPITVFTDNNISEDNFTNQKDKELFNYIIEHQKDYGKLPDIAVARKKFPDIKDIKLPQESVDFFVDRFIESYKTYLLRLTAEGIAEGLNKDEDVDSIISSLAEANTLLQQNAGRKEINSLIPLSEACETALEAAVKRRRQTEEISGVSFGFEFIDKVTDGAQKGDFITIAARPKVGKTHILCNAANAAYDQGKRVMVATFEMPPIQLARRIIERRTNMPAKNLKFGQVTTFGEKKLRKHFVELKGQEASGHSMMVYHGSLFTTIDKLSSKISEVNPDVLFVDGAYLLKLSKGNNKLNETVAESASFLKNIAMARDIPVIATYQINREGIGKKGGSDNMMYSDAMAQLASIAFILKFMEETNTQESTSWGSALKRVLKIDRDRDGEAAEVEVELNFGRKPFRITRVISGDLSHIGYGKADEEFSDSKPFNCLDGFSAAE